MKAHSNEYKEQIKLLGRQIDSKITYTIDNEEIELGPENLNSITPSFKGAILKSVMKELEIDSNQEIPLGTEVNYQFGLKVGNTYEYLDYGNYIVNKVEKQEDNNSWIITCYDKMLYSMTDYEEITISEPITIKEYIIRICQRLQLTFANEEDTFCNYDKTVDQDLFTNQGLTYRDVLDQIAEVTGSMVYINNNDELELRYIVTPESDVEMFDEEYLKDINVKFGEKFGPINTVVLSRSANSDNIYISYPEDLPEEDRIEIKISDNQFMNFNDRDQYLPDLLETLKGIEFYINDYSSTGITYLELGDYYNVVVGEETYKCLMLNDTLEISQGISEDIFTPQPEQAETDYRKSDKTDNRINKAYIIVDKQNQQIEALTSRVETLGDGYTKEEVNQLIQNATEGVTNKFITNGGNNILRNTGLWFEDRSEIDYMYPSSTLYPSDELFMSADPHFEYWKGNAKKIKEDKAINMSGILLQLGYLEQEQQVRNGTYTLSFKYRKLIQLANCNLQINEKTIDLTETTDTEVVYTFEVTSLYVNIKLFSDTDDACVIYDLMLNIGSEKAEYSQHPNETTTETVNISKGITITSSDTNTTFKANTDGIRVYNNQDLDNPVTKYTDTGMDTNRINVSEEAQIVKVLWKDVGNNTWISRL